MTIKTAIPTALCVASIGLWTGGESLAHEVVGVPSFHACQPSRARAFLRSPNPGAGNRDYPLAVLDAAGTPTGEHVVVISVQNSSEFDARVTAVGFAWPGAGAFELVQPYRAYNDLTINNAGVRTGTIGPNDYAVASSLLIGQPHGDVELSVRHDVHGVPGFPHTTLNFALVTGQTFAGGRPAYGLATDTVRHVIAFKGVLPAGGIGSRDIEGLLDDAYVRFRQVGAPGEGSETGIWRNLLPPVSCL